MSVTINGTSGLVFNDASTQNTAATGFGFKNRILNGNMTISQRNGTSSLTLTSSAYTLDRWYSQVAQASKMSIQQDAGGVTPPTGFSDYLGVTSLAATTVGSTDYYTVEQRIEGFNFADLAFGTASASPVTLSFWVRSSLTGTFGGALRNSASSYGYPFTYTISSANTWEQKSITITGATAGTWIGATNGIGANLIFSMGMGSSYSGTAGAWAAADVGSATGATSVVSTNGATWYVTGVQLEKGSTATSFDYRPYGTELALCQRYFEKSFNQSVAVGTATSDGRLIYTTGILASASNSILATTITFASEKRSAPTMNTWDANGNSGKITTFNATASPTQNVTPTFGFGETSTRATRLAHQEQIAGFGCSWTASAEL
jgi:hypothetical protein